MSTIADFFTVSSAPAALKTPRVTHGTTCYIYTYGCCSSCNICIPTASTGTEKWSYEMWGQGGGGASGCCCYYSPYGGGGGQYGAARQTRSTSTPLLICACACSCWCCYYNGMYGHPGQFSRICEGNFIGWTMSTSGGIEGWTCCNYLWSYPYDCNIDKAVWAAPHMTSAFSSGGGGGGGSCRFRALVPNTCNNGNADAFGNPITELARTSTQAAPTSGGSGALPGAYASVGSYYPGGGCCQCGTHTATVWNCNVTERLCFNGSCGYAAGTLGQTGLSNNNYLGIGIGGSSYAGGNAQPYHSCTQTWTWAGCIGQAPGGGGSSSGGCQGSCCYGSVGGAGLIIVSYDN